ncbi:hypothetical protein IMG5_117620 [Ichthyophthirius multifiliis]|uniref:Calpain catalytic domain-containing protein n=1 Tax=Ichthyophthirius multifiliis TaxID=5932 RepID=G0QUJ9_ICHMU|nr:hypothetical protein IMG5_117620 [Ichthyophthirius multifiliis]EGR31119.1 hypothetical protein IMG5_117620 [Ichthyophthirius multifiliis]|eukprot:XP_004034605.1 hypothetical protein IMG5_117620 [Ichthyophthirius multifiliis]
MPPAVNKKGKVYKQGIAQKDVIPSTFKGQIREGIQFKIPDQCQIVSTLETQQEVEYRIKNMKTENEKKNTGIGKKGAKKDENNDTQPQLIKEIRLSNIDMSFNVPDDSKWIASQLQMIKDRNICDCYTNKPIWTKIFPQQDNIPAFNQSGKYWVKLYYMGKERKIEIDDKMPVNFNGQCIFPRSVKKEEIWTFIFSKAILKVIEMSSNVLNIRSLVGSGFIMYSLTGLQSQCVPIHIQDSEQVQFIKDLLSDKHFSNRDIYVSCYAGVQMVEIRQSSFQYSSDKKFQINQDILENENYNNDSATNRRKQRNLTVGGLNQVQMQMLENLKLENVPLLHENEYEGHENNDTNEETQSDNYQSPVKKKSKANSLSQQVSQLLSINKYNQDNKPNYVIPGFAYPVVECFYNDQFNMVFAQKKSDNEIKYRKEYNDILSKNINKMSKEQKIETRKRKKELKDKIFEEEKKRLELINKPPIQYLFFKIKTGVSKVPLLNIFSCFTHDELNIAKTCILNNVIFQFKIIIFILFFALKKKLTKPPNYQENSEIKDDSKQIMSQIQKNANSENFLQTKTLNDFSSVQNLLQPVNRGLGGLWVQDIDIQNIFQHFQIYYNPNKFYYNKIVNVSQSEEFEFTIGEESEVLIIERNTNDEENNNTISLLFSFIFKESKTAKIVPDPYCILQKFNFQQFCSYYEYPLFKENQSCQLLKLENKNHVFKIQAYTPVAYSLSISSNNNFRTCSIANYLTEYEGYQLKSFNIDYNAFEQNKYNMLFRFRIQKQANESSFVLKLKCKNDKQLLKYMTLKVKEQNDQEDNEMLTTIEGVHKNLYENSYMISSYLRIQLKQNTTYYIILEGLVPYNAPEGILQTDFYTKDQLEFINIEHLEPIKYVDKYVPSKYGIIFREKIFVSELTIVTLNLRIAELINNQQGGGNNIDNKKKGKDQQQFLDFQEKIIIEKINIKLELLEDGITVIYSYGLNQALISNIILKPNKNQNKSYILQATFDLNEWPYAKSLNEKTENIYWFLKVFSSETLVFAKDTDKEEKQKEVIKSWEDKEQGRAEKAKKSRKKYQILLKKKKELNYLMKNCSQQTNLDQINYKEKKEKIQDCLANFNIDLLKDCFENFKKYSVQGIEQEIIDKMDKILEEAENNPNFQIEKQAELKKAVYIKEQKILMNIEFCKNLQIPEAFEVFQET